MEGNHLATLIDQAYATRHAEDGMRRHLGGSVIGKKCLREIWFTWHWVDSEPFEGRMLRLFHRGHREEDVIADLLRSIGAEVWTKDATTGKQFKVSALGGHSGGEVDGVARNLPGCRPVPHLLEMKTHNDRLFKLLVKDGVHKAQPKHVKQAQYYMHLMGLEACLYCAVNKNDDTLYFETFPYDPATGHHLIARGETVIFGTGLPPRISESPSWHECTFCAMKGVCFRYTEPRVNCRTCRFSRAERDGTWSCAMGQPEIQTAPKVGCLNYQKMPEL